MTTEIMQQWADTPTATASLSPEARNFVSEINSKRTEAETLGKETLAAELAFLNKTRECGVLLEDAKATLSHTQWALAQAEFAFTERQVQGLLQFARKFPQPITDAREAVRSLEDAQMALGFSEFPTGHGSQTIHEYNFAIELTKMLTNVRASLHKGISRSPIESWTQRYALQVVQQTEPVFNEIAKLVAQAKARAEQA